MRKVIIVVAAWLLSSLSVRPVNAECGWAQPCSGPGAGVYWSCVDQASSDEVDCDNDCSRDEQTCLQHSADGCTGNNPMACQQAHAQACYVAYSSCSSACYRECTSYQTDCYDFCYLFASVPAHKDQLATAACTARKKTSTPPSRWWEPTGR